jgi:hypothetical protein
MYTQFFVVVLNKANKRSIVSMDCGTLEYATVLAQQERNKSKRTVFVREYTQDGLFGKRKFVREHSVA